MPLAPGDQVTGLRGTYRVQAVHGQGSFGVTYRATDAAGSPVILKELRIEKLADWKALELFEREGEVLATLSHPNIPAFRDFFAHGGPAPLPVSAMSSYDGPARLSLVLVQELIEGSTLQHRLDRAQPLTPGEVGSILRELLAALSYLHERDPPLVHRDIKPGNVILTPAGRPYLVDFGAIQNRLRGADSVGSTVVGTLGYMPLEQLRGQAVPASDLYALGMTMVVALAAQPPEQLPVDESSGKVALDRVLPAGTGAPLRDALDAMIEVLSGRRVHSAAEVLAHLDAAPRMAPPPPSSPREHHELTRRERRRQRALADVVLPVEPVVQAPLLRRLRARIGYEGLMVALALAVPAVILIAKNTGGTHKSGSTPSSGASTGKNTLFGKTLTTHMQAIPVKDVPRDTRFAVWPPPAWVTRVATSWKSGAKLAGMVAGHVDTGGVITLGEAPQDDNVDYSYVADGCCDPGFSSGVRTKGTLEILVDAPDGAVRVSVAENPNTTDKPIGTTACTLPEAFAVMVNAGRLLAAADYDVRNYDPPMAARWEFSTDHFVRIVGTVDVATCAVIR